MLLHFKWICLIFLKSVELCFDIKILITFSFESYNVQGLVSLNFFLRASYLLSFFKSDINRTQLLEFVSKRMTVTQNYNISFVRFSSKKMEKSKDNSSSKKKKKNDQSMRGLANTLSSKKTPIFTICNKSLFLNSFLCALVICLFIHILCLFNSHLVYEVCLFLFLKKSSCFFPQYFHWFGPI